MLALVVAISLLAGWGGSYNAAAHTLQGVLARHRGDVPKAERRRVERAARVLSAAGTCGCLGAVVLALVFFTLLAATT